MDTKKVYVRVDLKTGAEQFFRTGVKFTREWQAVDVDDATAKYLHEQSMLEVSDTAPAGYVDPTAAPAAALTSDVVIVAPTDPVERDAAIKAAIAKLDKADPTQFRTDGAPNVPALSTVLGWAVTAAERDAAWAEVSKV